MAEKQLKGLLYALIPEKLKSLPMHMDFAGQKFAERIFQITLVIFAVIGFIWGYICQQFSQTIYILFAGFIVTCLLTLPPWPIYQKSPLVWQPVQDSTAAQTESSPKHKKAK